MTAARREQLLSYAVLGVFSVIAIYPILSILLLAFHDRSDLVTGFSIPDSLDFGTFSEAWEVGNFGRGLLNSFIVAATVSVVSAVLSTLAGYAFGAMRFRGSNALFYLLLVGLIFPYEATVIPLYYVFKDAGLTDTYWALILPQIGLSVPFGTFWMRAFFRSTPSSLVEASRLDGASSFVTLWRVLLPQAWPAITTMLVLVFMWTWNEFLLALVMIQSDDLRTAPLGLALFAGANRVAGPDADRGGRGARGAAGRDRLRLPAAELHPRHVRRGGEGMSWVLGVDGGNTKTLAAVADASGRTRGAGTGGTADIYNAATPDDAIDAIEAAVSEALAEAGIAAAELDAAVFSLAGADWPEDFALLERRCASGSGSPPRRSSSTTRSARCAAARPTGPASRSSAAPTTRSARAIPTGACSTSGSGPTRPAGATSAARRCAPSTTPRSAWGRRPC